MLLPSSPAPNSEAIEQICLHARGPPTAQLQNGDKLKKKIQDYSSSPSPACLPSVQTGIRPSQTQDTVTITDYRKFIRHCLLLQGQSIETLSFIKHFLKEPWDVILTSYLSSTNNKNELQLTKWSAEDSACSQQFHSFISLKNPIRVSEYQSILQNLSSELELKFFFVF